MTFGFRGEALSSLCALSNMTITTRHASCSHGTRLELDHNGAITKQSICARSTGTSVTMANLFATLPVRKREFTKNIKKEFARMCQILQAYCLVSVGVRIICTNQTAKGGKSTVMATNMARSTLDNITAIFGARQTAEIVSIQAPLSDNDDDDPSNDVDGETLAKLRSFRLEGWISNHCQGSGRSSKDRQFVFINSRPCEPKTVFKTINECYHRYNVQQWPFIFLNILLQRSDVDVNLTPDKRQVLVANEKLLLSAIERSIQRTFGDNKSSFKMQNLNLTVDTSSMNEESVAMTDESDNDDSIRDQKIRPNAEKFSNMLSQWRLTGKTDAPTSEAFVTTKKRKIEDEIGEKTLKMKKIQSYLTQQQKTTPVDEADTKLSFDNRDDGEDCDFRTICPISQDTPTRNTLKTERRSLATPKTCETIPTTIMFDHPIIASPDDDKPDEEFKIICKMQTPKIRLPLRVVERTPPKTIILEDGNSNDDDDDADVLLLGFKTQTSSGQSTGFGDISVSDIKSLMLLEKEQGQRTTDRCQLNRLKFKAAIDPSKNTVAETELNTEIKRDDFARMHVIGQFNLGFIIILLDDDLFIVDQHASDERFNYEQLQLTTRLQSQPLVRGQSLDLTTVNEMILIDNRDVFEMNGFKFEIDETTEPTKKCRLVAKPHSQNWEFGREDIDELLFMLQVRKLLF